MNNRFEDIICELEGIEVEKIEKIEEVTYISTSVVKDWIKTTDSTVVRSVDFLEYNVPETIRAPGMIMVRPGRWRSKATPY